MTNASGLSTEVYRYDTGYPLNIAIYNRIYNNGTNYQLTIQDHEDILHNYFKNNIFYKSDVTDILYVKGTVCSVDEIQSSDPVHFYGNIQQSPNLDNNYYPYTGSPCIDGGDYLTKTTSASTGNEIWVQDSKYFTDGWGIIEGDLIQLEGQAQTVRVTDVDYTNNTITIDQSLS